MEEDRHLLPQPPQVKFQTLDVVVDLLDLS